MKNQENSCSQGINGVCNQLITGTETVSPEHKSKPSYKPIITETEGADKCANGMTVMSATKGAEHQQTIKRNLRSVIPSSGPALRTRNKKKPFLFDASKKTVKNHNKQRMSKNDRK